MKKAIVVGASSGIGKEIALILANNNYQVGITGRRTDLLLELKQQKPDQFFVKTFDTTDTVSVPGHLNALKQELGGLDLLVFSSGTGDLNDPFNIEIEKRTLDTNVSGFTCVAVWAFNFFEKLKHGHLTAISSIAGISRQQGCSFLQCHESISNQLPGRAATKSQQTQYAYCRYRRCLGIQTLVAHCTTIEGTSQICLRENVIAQG